MTLPAEQHSPREDEHRSDRGEMGLFEHLSELRKRIINATLAIVAGAVAAYFFAQELFSILNAPYHAAFSNAQLIGTGPAEAFLLRIKVSLFAGAVLASPIVFFQVWRFVEPGLLENERKLAIPFVTVTTALFLGGVLFCYYLIFPLAFSFFFDEYASIGITPTIRASEHLSLMVQTMLAFGVVFEMPVLAFLLGRLGIIDHRSMLSAGRYAVVIIFVVSAVLTPPDAISQLLMAIPLMLLYGASIIIVRYTAKARLESPKIEGRKETRS